MYNELKLVMGMQGCRFRATLHSDFEVLPVIDPF
jgi:hypothetical protein